MKSVTSACPHVAARSPHLMDEFARRKLRCDRYHFATGETWLRLLQQSETPTWSIYMAIQYRHALRGLSWKPEDGWVSHERRRRAAVDAWTAAWYAALADGKRTRQAAEAGRAAYAAVMAS
jgi:hypothetical protein